MSKQCDNHSTPRNEFLRGRELEKDDKKKQDPRSQKRRNDDDFKFLKVNQNAESGEKSERSNHKTTSDAQIEEFQQ